MMMTGMDDVMMPETDGAAMAPSPTGSSLTVPLSALTLAEETGANVQPAPGDRVSVQVDGTVVSIEGGNVVLEPSAFNGEPVGQTPLDDASATGDPEMDALMGQALEQGGL